MPMNPISRFWAGFRGGIQAAKAPRGQPPPRQNAGTKVISRVIHAPWQRGDYTLANSELIFAAASRLANSLATMPVRVCKNRRPVAHPFNELLRLGPNPNMTGFQFFQAWEACRCTNGNGYVLKVMRPDMTLERLDLLDPSKVKPMIDENTKEIYYRLQLDGQTTYVHSWYMLHTRFLSTNGVIGISPVAVLHNTLNYAANIQRFSVEQLEKGVNAAVCLTAPSSLSEEQRMQAVESFRTVYRETGGNILMLESGLTAQALNLSPVDSKLFEVEKISRSKVALVYNIPPHLLGDYSDASFSTMEEQMQEFQSLALLANVTQYEQVLTKGLLLPSEIETGLEMNADMDIMLRANARTRADVNYKAVRSGWKTPDEIRESENLPELPQGIGKEALVSKDLTTLSQILAGKGGGKHG